MKRWYEELFDHIDNKRLEQFLAFVADDIRLTFGNEPCAAGKEEVRAALNAFWQSIRGLKHNFVQVFEIADHVIFEGKVSYTRLDERVVSVPCATFIRLSGGLVSEWRIYTDLSPVFAAT